MRKRMLITIILALTVFSGSVHAYVPPGVTGYTIYAGYVPQQQSKWCWAASAQNVAKVEYPSSTRTQSNIVTHIKGSAINDYVWFHSETKEAAEYACYDTKSFSSAGMLYYSVLSDLIYNGHPVIAFLSAGLIKPGHYVLFMGWGISESNENLIYLYDPGNGGSYQCYSYYGLCSGAYLNLPYNHSIYYGG
ncbi:MAG: hypothetical protein IJL47_05615 [Lachnospiraceae bacterium]|nr:hypothetical protein [Lachnospiraceae bacterium]MBQ6197014.1 hypothetical protein [Lachnospiraceae bacterium]